jgi:hypothetical protein
MRRSTERILTTHSGSLPRPGDLIPMLCAKESGELRDEAAFEARVQTAVAEIVKRQSAAGVDIINNGEVSKASYKTYVRKRLSGFGGTAQQRAVALSDLTEVGMEPGGRRRTRERNRRHRLRFCHAGQLQFGPSQGHVAEACGDGRGRAPGVQTVVMIHRSAGEAEKPRRAKVRRIRYLG